MREGLSNQPSFSTMSLSLRRSNVDSDLQNAVDATIKRGLPVDCLVVMDEKNERVLGSKSIMAFAKKLVKQDEFQVAFSNRSLPQASPSYGYALERLSTASAGLRNTAENQALLRDSIEAARATPRLQRPGRSSLSVLFVQSATTSSFRCT